VPLFCKKNNILSSFGNNQVIYFLFCSLITNSCLHSFLPVTDVFDKHLAFATMSKSTAVIKSACSEDFLEHGITQSMLWEANMEIDYEFLTPKDLGRRKGKPELFCKVNFYEHFSSNRKAEIFLYISLS
jgi:hypothetical protein